MPRPRGARSTAARLKEARCLHEATATNISFPAIPAQVILAHSLFSPGRISVVVAIIPSDDRKVRLGSDNHAPRVFAGQPEPFQVGGITGTCAAYFPVRRFSQNSIASAASTRHSLEIRYPTSLPVRSHWRTVQGRMHRMAASSSVVRARSYVARR